MCNPSLSFSENLPDPGKAQDFMKKFNQVLGEDEKLRLQLEQLISPTCSCKQAEQCVVSLTASSLPITFSSALFKLILFINVYKLDVYNANDSELFQSTL